MNDHLKKYLFENRSVRIQAVRLEDTWRDALTHHAYTPAVRRLLGELVAAATLLAANIKFDGSLLLQIQGDGPISLVVVECKMEPARAPIPQAPEGTAGGSGRPGTAVDLSLRATVKVREGQVVPEDGTLQSLLNAHGEGRFMVLLDPRRKTPGQQTYQGIVPLEGDTVAQVLEHYMKASEQLDTRLWLAADDRHAAGLLVQRLPDHGGQVGEAPDEAWNRATQLASTLGADELLAVDTDTLIHRLYWEETLLTFDPQNVRWHCPCGRERVAEMLRMLGRDEVDSILAEQGQVEVLCDFCGKPYRFDSVDCAGLFAARAPMADAPHPPTVH
ncbi:MAG: Hsp33 family molecular chaperone HslO [Bordetella sp.]|uniref:Hsp33 family molecular chaperone HslO n=1 Tax=Bordetella sp. TaxID=28081 RepID=UPI003F7BC36F